MCDTVLSSPELCQWQSNVRVRVYDAVEVDRDLDMGGHYCQEWPRSNEKVGDGTVYLWYRPVRVFRAFGHL